jgi:hypothetical protein
LYIGEVVWDDDNPMFVFDKNQETEAIPLRKSRASRR